MVLCFCPQEGYFNLYQNCFPMFHNSCRPVRFHHVLPPLVSKLEIVSAVCKESVSVLHIRRYILLVFKFISRVEVSCTLTPSWCLTDNDTDLQMLKDSVSRWNLFSVAQNRSRSL